MPKIKPEINPEWAIRLKQVLDEQNITQIELSEKIFYSQQHISRVMNEKATLTTEMAKAIHRAFPEYRLSWLLGFGKREYPRFEDMYLDRMAQRLLVREFEEMIEPIGYALYPITNDDTNAENRFDTTERGENDMPLPPIYESYQLITSEDSDRLIAFEQDGVPLDHPVKPLATLDIDEIIALNTRFHDFMRWEIQKLTGEWK